MTTKEKILYKTIELLNEYGISNVKMRNVSEAMNISVGNLTYHYPKWENLIDDIFKKFEEEMSKISDFFPKDISDVVPYLDKIYNIQISYSFMFSNLYVFFRLYPKYENGKEKFIIQRMKAMREGLNSLIHTGFLLPADEDHDYDLLVKNVWMVYTGWYSFSKTVIETPMETSKYEFFTTIWNLFAFHLSEKARDIVKQSYDEIIEKKEK